MKFEEQLYADGTWVRQHSKPSPDMELIGSRFQRGRQQAGMTQRQVAAIAGVSQSEVSRLERGRGGGISTYRFVAIGMALGPGFPFGCCPHEHRCAYPPFPDAPRSPLATLQSQAVDLVRLGTAHATDQTEVDFDEPAGPDFFDQFVVPRR